MTHESIDLHPSHEWVGYDENDGDYLACDVCGICNCHSPSKAGAECPGEPDFGDEELND